MDAISPVPQLQEHEIVLAKDQPQYQPLPCIRSRTPEGRVLTRWRLTDEERRAIARGADVYLETLTFRGPFQPVSLYVGGEPDAEYVADLCARFHFPAY